ncbi:hypothetical protein SAMN05660297_02652 [Natronincola peptidivorans]|uniref:Uncharacterized protein n=1 Tax=Natronincola peptidivorans TaxID=426128 RepID=A0A1I0F2A9_9FIRM|nr:hypothetical protein [Natronincola peptidivorans]SET52135.1 hypothetical protein SAMN05660297_02652 [Natronincola peptidivorans]
MTDHYINHATGGNIINNKELENLIKDIGDDDELIITFEGADADKSSYVLSLLEENGFEVLPKGGHDNNRYQLVARRSKN